MPNWVFTASLLLSHFYLLSLTKCFSGSTSVNWIKPPMSPNLWTKTLPWLPADTASTPHTPVIEVSGHQPFGPQGPPVSADHQLVTTDLGCSSNTQGAPNPRALCTSCCEVLAALLPPFDCSLCRSYHTGSPTHSTWELFLHPPPSITHCISHRPVGGQELAILFASYHIPDTQHAP